MIDTVRSDLEGRVLVLAPTPKDGAITTSVLEHLGVDCVVCEHVDIMLRELERGAGMAIVAEQALAGDGYAAFKAILDRQVPWSDLPLIVLTLQGSDSPGANEAFEGLGNVSVLECPVRVSALVSAVRSALRARSRQYQIRDHLRERELAAERLREANRRKDEFLAILAHELRNPLAPIRNAVEVIKRSGAGGLASDGLTAMIERHLDHMVRLVDDLFEVSRITRGDIALRKRRVDLAEILRDAIDANRPSIAVSRQLLAVDVGTEPLVVEGDPVRLAQVFGNLINNASKYSEAEGSIWLRAQRDGDTVDVSVRDAGMGIAPELLPRIFDMFTHADARANRAKRGLGLGLTLAKSLVEQHGGSLVVGSAGPGLGSTFHVRLPLAPSAAPSIANRTKPASPAGATTRHVLVVDDNRDSADSIVLLLKLLGAEAEVAYDGPSSLTAIDTHRPDAVILDIGLPGMDGYEVARRIRRRPELDSVMLIALTGWGQPEDRLRTKEAGFQHHLVKPVDANLLQSLLTAPTA